MTLQEINNRIHSIPTPSELESSLESIKLDISGILSQSTNPFHANYYRNHTGRELFRKLNNFGLQSLIFDDYDSGWRPLSTNGVAFIELTASTSNDISYTFTESSLAESQSLNFKISGNTSGNFVKIFESETNTTFTLTVNGSGTSQTIALNDGFSTFATLSEGQSFDYTLSNNNILTFTFSGFGSILFSVEKKLNFVDVNYWSTENADNIITESGDNIIV